MNRLNFRDPNKIESSGYRGPTTDDLFGMFQQMRAQGLVQEGRGYAQQSGASLAGHSGPGGLLGRWLELQAAQPQS